MQLSEICEGANGKAWVENISFDGCVKRMRYTDYKTYKSSFYSRRYEKTFVLGSPFPSTTVKQNRQHIYESYAYLRQPGSIPYPKWLKISQIPPRKYGGNYY
jgi:hypothetical protein